MSKGGRGHGGMAGPKPKRLVHTCLFCDKVLQSYQALNFHTNGHTGERPYQCPDCGDIFTDPRYLWGHRKKMHTLVGLGQRDSSKGSQKRKRGHRLKGTSTSDQPTKSRRGGKSTRVRNREFTDDKSQPRYQVVIENDKERFKCPSCSQLFSRSNSVTQHLRTVHSIGSLFKCNFCGIRIANSKVLWEHKKSSHVDQLRVFPCSECDKMFVDKHSLKRHQKSFHPEAGVESLSPPRVKKQSQSESEVCSRDNAYSKPEMNLEAIMQWQKRMQQEYQAENREYQQRLASFIWSMNKQQK